jgi:hypothetical protein
MREDPIGHPRPFPSTAVRISLLAAMRRRDKARHPLDDLFF